MTKSKLFESFCLVCWIKKKKVHIFQIALRYLNQFKCIFIKIFFYFDLTIINAEWLSLYFRNCMLQLLDRLITYVHSQPQNLVQNTDLK